MNSVGAMQFDLTPPSEDERRELESALSEEERHVLLEHGTEAPFCGVFLTEKRDGAYTCRLCGLPLFKAGNKFEARYAWSAALVTAENDVATRLKAKIETGLTPANAAP